ncbi:hypothetical protein BDZ91DRAFT_767807 [Kalaharituber pfeilii]|nr:hypothetical protein BDZ91DRAFT_767807 [Kalaharituber pfeilii]
MTNSLLMAKAEGKTIRATGEEKEAATTEALQSNVLAVRVAVASTVNGKNKDDEDVAVLEIPNEIALAAQLVSQQVELPVGPSFRPLVVVVFAEVTCDSWGRGRSVCKRRSYKPSYQGKSAFVGRSWNAFLTRRVELGSGGGWRRVGKAYLHLARKISKYLKHVIHVCKVVLYYDELLIGLDREVTANVYCPGSAPLYSTQLNQTDQQSNPCRFSITAPSSTSDAPLASPAAT